MKISYDENSIKDLFIDFKNDLRTNQIGYNLKMFYLFCSSEKWVFNYVLEKLNFYEIYNYLLFDFQKKYIKIGDLIGRSDDENKNDLINFVCLNFQSIQDLNYENMGV